MALGFRVWGLRVDGFRVNCIGFRVYVFGLNLRV